MRLKNFALIAPLREMSFIRVIRSSVQIRDSDKVGNRKSETIDSSGISLRLKNFALIAPRRYCLDPDRSQSSGSGPLREMSCHSSVSSGNPRKSVILTNGEIGSRKSEVIDSSGISLRLKNFAPLASRRYCLDPDRSQSSGSGPLREMSSDSSVSSGNPRKSVILTNGEIGRRKSEVGRRK